MNSPTFLFYQPSINSTRFQPISMKFFISFQYGIFALTFLAGGQQTFLSVLSFIVQYNHCWIYPFLQKFRKWWPQFFITDLVENLKVCMSVALVFIEIQQFLCRIKNTIAEAYLKIQMTERSTKIALTFNG